MNLAAALKAVAPAVGDGRIVPMHAYVALHGDSRGSYLFANNGELSVEALVTDTESSFCVNHEALTRAMARDDVRLAPHAATNGVVATAGRSRITVKGVDAADFPGGMSFVPSGRGYAPGEPFLQTLRDLSKFTSSGDGHIWQMGTHFRHNFVFAFGPFAAIFREWEGMAFDLSVPPWAAKFMLAQSEPPTSILDGANTFRARWGDMSMTSSRLIEDAPDGVHSFIENLPREGGQPVPANLKETLARIKSYGITRFRLANGKIEHVDDKLEIVEEIDLDVPARVWPVAQALAALEFAETIDLSDAPAKWHGNGYHGAFNGMSG